MGIEKYCFFIEILILLLQLLAVARKSGRVSNLHFSSPVLVVPGQIEVLRNVAFFFFLVLNISLFLCAIYTAG